MTDPLLSLYESISNKNVSELIVSFRYKGSTGYYEMEDEIDDIASSLGLQNDGAENTTATFSSVRTIYYTGNADAIVKLYDILDKKYPGKLGLEIRDSE